MNKFEITMVALLVALLICWGFVEKSLSPKRAPAKSPQHAAAVTNDATAASDSAPADAKLTKPEEEKTSATPEQAAPVRVHAADERVVSISNDVMVVSVTSWGGGVSKVDLRKYRALLNKKSGPVSLDFSEMQALSHSGMQNFSTNCDYEVSASDDGKTARVSRQCDGLNIVRTLAVTDGYLLKVVDSYSNTGSSPVVLPARGISTGPMKDTGGTPAGGGASYLGVDTLPAQGGEDVKHWGTDIPSFYGVRRSIFGCSRIDAASLAASVSHKTDYPVTWAAAKNKFFVQILIPGVSASDCEIRSTRDLTVSNGLVMNTVSANVIFPEKLLQPGETFVNEMGYYVGPKEFSSLKQLKNNCQKIMEFGKWFGWLCEILLWILVTVHGLVPNYGLAIIILTIIVRLALFPVTQKSNKSMREMQKVQPLITDIREKYKDKPAKMQEEIMAVYKEHKINPMAGCLPILLQLPVFFALFTVLRSAVELRFAPFLWVKDLSEPENLFAGTAFFKAIPFVGALNLLPLLMTATTIWQSKLTPQAGDPQQQKMMMWMPIIFLVMFYNMASALVLYWTVSQLLGIFGLLWQKHRAGAETASAT